MNNYQWQPGNGTNYDINVVQHDDKVLLCWMLYGGSGGVCMKFSVGGLLHWSYMSEKLGIKNRADLAGIMGLVHKLGLAEVGMPEGYGLDGLDDGHRRMKEEMERPPVLGESWTSKALVKQVRDLVTAHLDSLPSRGDE